ncbi:MAG: transcriptional repressor NrdR [Rickettsiaceae bacterium H1]|nr:transcriptional repressor NrdR [Rickettsiaceae bacterium H1]
MKCPFCASINTHVKDSRASEDNSAIRRRRICAECSSRFTTFERIQLRELTVIKQNGTLKPFDRDKLTQSITVALRKRPIDIEQIEMTVNSIVYKLESLRLNKIASDVIGKMVMEKLKKIDRVGYIRFASVYMNFSNVEDFNEIVEKLIK